MFGKSGARKFLLLVAGLVASVAAPLSASQPWPAFGPDGGDARRIAPDPRDHQHLYLGTANGWIYESRNAGNNWTRLAQIGKRDDLVLDSILVDVANSKHIVVGGWVVDHHDGGLYSSWDGGLTWTNQAEMRGQSVLSLTASVSDPKSMVAGTLQGVFRSNDGGQRWHRISPADSTEIHEVQSVAIDPKDPDVIYAGTWHLPWKTTDGGEHWDNIKQGIIEDSDVFSIIVDPTTPSTVFASACSGIYKSEDAGALFRKIQGIPATARRTRRLLQDPNHLETVFAGTTEGLYRSNDSGKTWARTTGPEIIVNDVAVDLSDAHRVLIATDRGGVMASDDGGDTFHSSNNGFSARQITTLKRDSEHSATLYVGVVNDKDWGGVFQSDNGGLAWTQRSEGLEGRDVFSLGQAPDGTMIAGTSHGLYRLDRSAQAWARVEDAPAGQGAAEPAPVVLARPPVPTRGRRAAPVPAKADAKKPFTKKPLTKKPLTVAQRKAAALKARSGHAVLAARRVGPNRSKKQRTIAKAEVPVKKKAPVAVAHTVEPVLPVVQVKAKSFDGAVYSLVTAEHTILAATSVGLLTSSDNGISWLASGPENSADWRFLAAAKKNVVAGSLHAVQYSADAGTTWDVLKLPEQLTQVSAVAVVLSGEVWVGGREGIFTTTDGGATWSAPKNLTVNAVTNIFYDESSERMMITTAGNSSIVFTVQLPGRQVTFTDTGWNLRFARPIGDHLLAVTLYDGVVVQPRMMPSPLAPLPSAPQAASAPRVVGPRISGPVQP